MELSIEAVGKYTQAQRGMMNQSFCGICLNISGLIYSEVYTGDGKLYSLYDEGGVEMPPSLSLSLSGIRHRFEYNSNRENWILFLRQPCPFYYSAEQDSHFLRSPVCDFPIRSRILLEKDEIPALRRLFQEIRHKTQSGLPQELAEAELLACDLLRRFLKPESAGATHSAAIRFRERIDSDPDCRRSLDELATETGYSRDHIRQLFVAEFGIPPGEYRIRQRLARIIRLISGTDLSMKEIAAEVGIAHTSYLNQLIRKYYHTTPLELCRKLRRLSS